MSKIFISLFVLFITSFSVASELPYDFSDVKSIPIKLHILKGISTKDGLTEGSKIDFVAVKDVKYNGKTIVKSGLQGCTSICSVRFSYLV